MAYAPTGRRRVSVLRSGCARACGGARGPDGVGALARRLAGQLENAIARAERRYTPFSAAIPVCHEAAARRGAPARPRRAPRAPRPVDPDGVRLARELLVDGAGRSTPRRPGDLRAALRALGPWTPMVPALAARQPAESARGGPRALHDLPRDGGGVGKTYRMLLEATPSRRPGATSSSGCSRPTGARRRGPAEGLPVVPQRRVTYRGTDLSDMDLPAILRRKPELVLVDELAHTNAPGLEHEKRYEDIEDLLDAGIDVLSTVNVQHLESLNDQVAELSGARVRETIPDSVLGRADEVVLIDLSPEALLARLRAGKIYKPERVEAALNGFFRIENLAALREVALRQVAEEVEAKRLVTEVVGTREDTLAADLPQAVGERLLALVEPYPGAQRLVRRAWRSSQRLGAQLDLLWVAPPGREPDPEQERQLQALRQLASVLGADLIVEPGDDVADTVARVARERGTHLHPPRPLAPRPRARPPARPPPPAPHAGAPRRRRPHRRRPLPPTREDTMSTSVVVAVIVIAFAGGTAAGWFLLPRARRRPPQLPRGTRRILLPFTGMSISRRAFDAAVRLARAEDATIMPAYLARVPRHPRRSTRRCPPSACRRCRCSRPSSSARARRASPVDARIIRGRTYRDALQRMLDAEPVDRVIVSATSNGRKGLSADDLEWMLEKVPAEVLILRPDPEDHRKLTAEGVAGHF